MTDVINTLVSLNVIKKHFDISRGDKRFFSPQLPKSGKSSPRAPYWSGIRKFLDNVEWW